MEFAEKYLNIFSFIVLFHLSTTQDFSNRIQIKKMFNQTQQFYVGCRTNCTFPSFTFQHCWEKKRWLGSVQTYDNVRTDQRIVCVQFCWRGELTNLYSHFSRLSPRTFAVFISLIERTRSRTTLHLRLAFFRDIKVINCRLTFSPGFTKNSPIVNAETPHREISTWIKVEHVSEQMCSFDT